MPSYDGAQICMNGHVVNGRADSAPGLNKSFCGKCGATTQTECKNCKSSIHGDLLSEGSSPGVPATLSPEFCHNCGKAHSWKGKIHRTDAPKTLYERWKEKVLNHKIGAALALVVVASCAISALWSKLPDDLKNGKASTTTNARETTNAPEVKVKLEINGPVAGALPQPAVLPTKALPTPQEVRAAIKLKLPNLQPPKLLLKQASIFPKRRFGGSAQAEDGGHQTLKRVLDRQGLPPLPFR